MNIEIMSVELGRGIQKQRGRLAVVPDDKGYVIRLKLEDGRFAYLAGSEWAPQAEAR